MMGFFKKDDCLKHYKMGKTLGTGSFATVKKATHKSEGGVWAIKCINKANLAADDEEALQTEVNIMNQVSHPNIITLKEVYDTPKTFYMVIEIMSGGELFDRIVEKEKYGEEEARAVIKKVASALAYCHEQGIVHRDLKPENLLLSSAEDDAEIKIADFGLAKLLKQETLMQTACGTPGYVAPEILEGSSYDSSVDVWSLGVITYIILCGFPPFYDENNAQLFAAIKSGSFDYPSPYWDPVSDEAKDLINKMLVVDPSARLTCNQVLEHPWIVGDQAYEKKLDMSELRKFNIRRKFKAGMAVAKVAAAISSMSKA
jgi:calcium/calmodulin-dependent protein kinase I